MFCETLSVPVEMTRRSFKQRSWKIWMEKNEYEVLLPVTLYTCLQTIGSVTDQESVDIFDKILHPPLSMVKADDHVDKVEP